MKRISVFYLIAAILILLVACVKDLEKEGVYDETEIIGTVVEKSTNMPLSDIKVKVTDGDRIHASSSTGADGTFRMTVNFEELNDKYYLLLDGSPNLPSKQEELHGFGNDVYDYKTLVLYDKTDTNLLPHVTTGEASNILAHTATVRGTVSFSGGQPLTERGVCYSTHQSPTIKDSCRTSGAEVGNFSCNLTNLRASTTYYYKAYAINNIGITYGEQKTLTTTDGLPTVKTTTPTNVLTTSAQSGGNVTANGGTPVTARGICWNTTGNPDINGLHTTNGTGNGSFTANMTELSPGTTYHVRAYATNSEGTGYGNEITFATSKGTATLTIAEATNITASSALCSVTISSDGGSSVTERGICWSTAQYPTTAGSKAAIGSGTGTFTVSMSNLTPSTTYYVRGYAINSVGTYYSNQISFTTSNGLPTVTTGTVSNITANSAVCSGNVTGDGGFPVTAKGFCWSTSQYPTVSSDHSNNGSGTGSFNGSLTNLQVGTTYYVRAYATNDVGTVYGTQTTFTTENGLPIVTTTTPTLNGETVTTGGNVTSDGGFAVTERGVCYGTFLYPDLSSTYNHTTNGRGTGFYSSSFSLPMGSGKYYIRAYATNANGTTYGEQVTIIQPYDELPTFTYYGHTYKVAPERVHTWSDANGYCNAMTYCGFNDWRLPTIAELQQMYVDKNTIGGFNGGRYWSSSTGCNLSGQRKIVLFSDGTLLCEYEKYSCYYRPVRIDD